MMYSKSYSTTTFFVIFCWYDRDYGKFESFDIIHTEYGFTRFCLCPEVVTPTAVKSPESSDNLTSTYQYVPLHLKIPIPSFLTKVIKLQVLQLCVESKPAIYILRNKQLSFPVW